MLKEAFRVHGFLPSSYSGPLLQEDLGVWVYSGPSMIQIVRVLHWLKPSRKRQRSLILRPLGQSPTENKTASSLARTSYNHRCFSLLDFHNGPSGTEDCTITGSSDTTLTVVAPRSFAYLRRLCGLEGQKLLAELMNTNVSGSMLGILFTFWCMGFLIFGKRGSLFLPRVMWTKVSDLRRAAKSGCSLLLPGSCSVEA